MKNEVAASQLVVLPNDVLGSPEFSNIKRKTSVLRSQRPNHYTLMTDSKREKNKKKHIYIYYIFKKQGRHAKFGNFLGIMGI